MFWNVLATFVGTMGALQEGQSQAKAAAFNQNISRHNAGVTRVQGQLEEDRVRRDARRQIGAMRANVGASGMDETGSAFDLLSESMYEAELDALTTRYNYGSRATAYDMEANLYGQQGKDAKKASYLNAAAKLIGGGTKIWEDNQDYGGGPFVLGGGGGDYTITGTGETIRWNS